MKKQRAISLLVVLEVVAIIGLAVVWTRPVFRDYALADYYTWRQNATDQNFKTWQENQREGRQLRLIMASPFAISALLLPCLLFRRSQKP
jgi:hypothetical protein